MHRVLQPSGVTSRLDRAPALTPFVGPRAGAGAPARSLRAGAGEPGPGGADRGRGGDREVAAGAPASGAAARDAAQLARVPHSPYTQQGSASIRWSRCSSRCSTSGDDQTASRRSSSGWSGGSRTSGLEPAEALPLFASLLSLRLPERYAPLEISPQLQRQKTLETLLAWVLALGEKQPVVLVVEDLHWIDPSTLEWLGLLIEQCPTASVLLLADTPAGVRAAVADGRAPASDHVEPAQPSASRGTWLRRATLR